MQGCVVLVLARDMPDRVVLAELDPPEAAILIEKIETAMEGAPPPPGDVPWVSSREC
jgi:hypothetical protein